MPRPPTDDEFTELVHASWASLYRTAYLLVGERGEAEDLVQTALAKTYASWGRVRDVSAASGYARTALVNTASSWFRRKAWRNERPTDQLPDVGPRGRPDRPAGPGRRARAARATAARSRGAPLLRGPQRQPRPRVLSAAPRARSRVRPHDGLTRLRTLLGDAVVPHTSATGFTGSTGFTDSGRASRPARGGHHD